jgi:hypothetical protein
VEVHGLSRRRRKGNISLHHALHTPAIPRPSEAEILVASGRLKELLASAGGAVDEMPPEVALEMTSFIVECHFGEG